VTIELERVPELAARIRAHALRMVHAARASHIGTCLSMADILAVLYGAVLRVDPARPDWEDRDRFILSKGHGAAALYATLAERGFFPAQWLRTYCGDGSRLAGHVAHHDVPGVEVSSGSLGHGLSIACGMALAGRRDGRPYRVFALLSDGECDEGSIWEAVLFAPHHRLDNLVAVVDYNKIQSFGPVAEVLDLEPFAAKWRAFGWAVREVDGHDHRQLHDALRPGGGGAERPRPTVVIAHTVKGKGVSFMEDDLAWHYRSPSPEQLARALAELDGSWRLDGPQRTAAAPHVGAAAPPGAAAPSA
jgi:transketolase